MKLEWCSRVQCSRGNRRYTVSASRRRAGTAPPPDASRASGWRTSRSWLEPWPPRPGRAGHPRAGRRWPSSRPWPTPGRFRHLGQDVSGAMDQAALPQRRAQGALDGTDQHGRAVADHQQRAGQPALAELGQKALPGVTGLRRRADCTTAGLRRWPRRWVQRRASDPWSLATLGDPWSLATLGR
jgi:hypothetical protein